MVQPQAAIPGLVALVAIFVKALFVKLSLCSTFRVGRSLRAGAHLRSERTLIAEYITMTDLDGIPASTRTADFIPARLAMRR
jgi:hypothetical protein